MYNHAVRFVCKSFTVLLLKSDNSIAHIHLTLMVIRFLSPRPPLHLQVSTVYNDAIATSNTNIILNSVVVLFVMDMDEKIFAAIEAINEKWTKDEDEEAEKKDEEAETKDGEGETKEEDKVLAKLEGRIAALEGTQEVLLQMKNDLEQGASNSDDKMECEKGGTCPQTGRKEPQAGAADTTESNTDDTNEAGGEDASNELEEQIN